LLSEDMQVNAVIVALVYISYIILITACIIILIN